MDAWTVVELAVAAFAAGSVDAVVGGGGLIQLPMLFSTLPDAPPATLLGTSKFAGFSGTASAAVHYLRRVTLPWRLLVALAGLAFFSALAGAAAVTRLNPASFRPIVPVLLTGVLVWALRNREDGTHHAPRDHGTAGHLAGLAAVALIGFYDGFFGPGTGSFLMILAIRHYGYDYVRAAAFARVVNVATNLSALGWFAASGHVYWPIAVTMACTNALGAQVGTRVALRGGARLVRRVFLAVVVVLIARTTWDVAPLVLH